MSPETAPRVRVPSVLALLLGLLSVMSPLARAQTGTTRVPLPSPWIPGFQESIAGTDFEYHSPLPGVERALLVRSEDSALGIEWSTAPVPPDFDDEEATFVLLAAIDATNDGRRFTLSIDGRPVLDFTSPSAAQVGSLDWVGSDGVRGEFRVTVVDRYADAMGYLLLHVPRRFLRPGEPLRLSISGESSGSRTWFMVYKSGISPGISVRGTPAIVRTPNGPKQTVRVDVLYFGDRTLLRMEGPGSVAEARVDFGLTRLELEVPAARDPVSVPLSFEVDERRYETSLRIEPVPPLDLYLVHHTHLDIGYTHVQDEVERLQWAYLEQALELGEAGEAFPEEARFTWHPEGTWAVESYLATRVESKRRDLVDGIRRGWIHVDALFANLLTGLATGEALVRAVEAARDIAETSGVPIESAMFSDIPGMSWGVVPTLAQAGVRYLSLGPNRGHRIGSFLDTWADRPFWWESPSGRERVLAWVHGGGYSMFHTGLGYEHLETRLDEELVLAYADTLAARGWPHGLAGVRYNIGSDNGPPDSTLSATVAAWNDRHITPRLVLANVTELFRALEEEAGDELPVVRGDLTGYWEDGAASSARETALARRSAESLVQTETLAAMTGHPIPPALLDKAWRDVLLFLEHTWGSWNSVSEPEGEFTRSQWENKRAFAQEASRQATRLRERALGRVGGLEFDGPPHGLEVLNTSQWPRSEVVVLPPETSARFDRLRAEMGSETPTQRLADGSLAILPGDIPALSSRRFLAVGTAGARPLPTALPEDPVPALDNGVVRIAIDPGGGGLSSLVLLDSGRELVPDGEMLDEWWYVPGRDPSAAQPGGPARVRIVDAGPLVWTAVVQRQAPGTEAGLETRFRVYAGSDRIEITHRFDKRRTLDPEAVLLRYPVAVSGHRTAVSGPWGVWLAESDQPAGTNRNYATAERWADMHDGTGGLQVVSIDVPGIQLGSIGTDATVVGWRTAQDRSPVLYSYLMNNYWETNYRAAQDGPHELTYTLRPHSGFDVAEAERFAARVAQPLVVREVQSVAPVAELPFVLTTDHAVATLIRSTGAGDFLVRLHNAADEPDALEVTGRNGEPVSSVSRTDLWGRPGTTDEGPAIAPRGVATFLIRP